MDCKCSKESEENSDEGTIQEIDSETPQLLKEVGKDLKKETNFHEELVSDIASDSEADSKADSSLIDELVSDSDTVHTAPTSITARKPSTLLRRKRATDSGTSTNSFVYVNTQLPARALSFTGGFLKVDMRSLGVPQPPTPFYDFAANMAINTSAPDGLLWLYVPAGTAAGQQTFAIYMKVLHR